MDTFLLCGGVDRGGTVASCMFLGDRHFLMSLVGGIGLVVTFLFFFSVHPTVGSNWQIWVFNPIPLVAMPWVVWCAVKRRKTYYHPLNASVLILFMFFLP